LTAEDDAAGSQFDRQIPHLPVRALVDLFFEVFNHGKRRVNHVRFTHRWGRPTAGSDSTTHNRKFERTS
jgi:hypothetical protein